MGLEKWKNAAVSTVVAWLAVFGGLGCLVTGMRLDVNMAALLFGCAVMCALCCGCLWNRLWPVPLGAGLLVLFIWWRSGDLRASFEGLLYSLSDLYDQGYGWGIAQWSDRDELNSDATVALLAIAIPLSAAVSAALVHEGSGWMGAGAALLPMLGTVLLKDTVPAEGYLAMLLFAVALILLTDGVRSRSLWQSGRLSLMLSLPLALALGLMFLLIPQDTYSGQDGAQRLEDAVLQMLNLAELPEELELPGTTTGDQEKTVDLRTVGDRKESGMRVMTVKAQENKTLYLRGCAYDVYDGTTWNSTPGWNSQGMYFAVGGSRIHQLTVETESVHSVMYFTYAPYEEDRKVMGGRLKNEEGLRRYTARYVDMVEYSDSLRTVSAEVDEKQMEEYLYLPNETYQRAWRLIRGKLGAFRGGTAAQAWEHAQTVVDWVSDRAAYDLNTPAMPRDETDFALWFLEESDTGYCTHFASAAAVLLRATGIPAQYVTGYLVDARADRTVDVTAQDAHAWVEVYIGGVGWVVMEPTPGFGGGRPVPPDPTEPDETTGPTDPEETTGPTEPEVTTGTEPEQTQASTGPDQQTGSATGVDTAPYSHPTETHTGSAGLSLWGGAEPGTPARRGMLKGLMWLLAVFAGLAAVVAQWQLRLWLRKRKLRRGDHNRQALARWALLERMAALNRETPSEALHQLAQKAKFSQHTLSAEELAAFDRENARLRGALRKRNFAMQLVYTLVYALY